MTICSNQTESSALGLQLCTVLTLKACVAHFLHYKICRLITCLFISWGFLVFSRKDREHENGSWAITLATPS